MITWLFLLFVYIGLCYSHPNGNHPDVWRKESNGKLYMINPKLLAWSDANHECEIRSGKLLTIEDDHIEKIAQNITKAGKATNYWIGLVEDLFKHWTWEGGIGNPKYMNWETGQPSSGSLGGCAVMNPHGRWRVSDCEVTRQSICQREDDEGLVDIDNTEEVDQSKQSKQIDDTPSNNIEKHQGEEQSHSSDVSKEEHAEDANQSVNSSTLSHNATKKSKTQMAMKKSETATHPLNLLKPVTIVTAQPVLKSNLSKNKTNDSPRLINKTSEARNETKFPNRVQNVRNETLASNQSPNNRNISSNVASNSNVENNRQINNSTADNSTSNDVSSNVTSSSNFENSRQIKSNSTADNSTSNNVTSASQFHHVNIDEIKPLPEDKLYQRNNVELLKEWLTDFRKDELQDNDNAGTQYPTTERSSTGRRTKYRNDKTSHKNTHDTANRKDYLCDTPNGYRHQSGLCDLTNDQTASNDNTNNNNLPTSSSHRKNQVKHVYYNDTSEIDELLGVVLENEGLSESDQSLILGGQQQTTPSLTTMKMKLDEGSSLNEAEDQMFGKGYANAMKTDAPTSKANQNKGSGQEPTISYTSKSPTGTSESEVNKQKNNSNVDVFAVDKVTPTSENVSSNAVITPTTNNLKNLSSNATSVNNTNAQILNNTISINQVNNTALENKTKDPTTRTEQNTDNIQQNSETNSSPTQSFSRTKEVKTYGGNGGGEFCAFPFVYQEETFFHCITDRRVHPWCATTSSYDKMPLWGYCCKGTKCPTKPPTKPSMLYKLYTALTTQRQNNSAQVIPEQKRPKDNAEHTNPFFTHTTAHVLHKEGEEHLSIHSGLKTYGGNAQGARCVIPFVQDGHTHMKCIPRDDNTGWCATTHNYDKTPIWGNCCDAEHCDEMY